MHWHSSKQNCHNLFKQCVSELGKNHLQRCQRKDAAKTVKMIGQACPIRNRFARLPPAFPVATLSLTWITNIQKPKKRRWRKWEKKTIENAVPAHATNLTSWQVPPKASHFNVKGLAKWNQKFPQMTSWWVVLSKSQCWKLKECEGKRYERREITRVEKNVRSCEILWGEMQRAPVEVEASERAVWPRCSWQKCPEPPIVLHLTDLTQLTQLPQLTQFRFSRLLFLVVSREPEKTNNEQRLAT